MGRFYVENFGCRATQADGAAIERQFEDCGLERASAPSQAQIVVLNTCTVTAAADQDARAAIRRVRRENPLCRIVVTGCYAQRAPQELAALPDVSQVIGNSHKHRLAEIVLGQDREDLEARRTPLATEDAEALACDFKKTSTRLQSSPDTHQAALRDDSGFLPLTALVADARKQAEEAESPIYVSDIFAHTELLAAPVFDAANERTRPNLKVQDGCDNRCSFCVIPYVRGQSRSLRLEEVIHEVNTLVASGYREVVISGINLGRWGRDLLQAESPILRTQSLKPRARSLGFEDLVGAILDHTSLEKLRISSVEPMDWTDELISLVAHSGRIAKHAHVPMQSGSDAVLRRMHRKYRPWHYREKIGKIHAAMPTAAIGADVMVGFPGETDAEFDETRHMVEGLPFTYLHVFTYSPRPGTPAAGMKNQVPVRVARERNRVLRELAATKKLTFMRSFLGKTVDAITLNSSLAVIPGEAGLPTCERAHDVAGCATSEDKMLCTEALTDNYLKLRLKGRHTANRWIKARIEAVRGGALEGSL